MSGWGLGLAGALLGMDVPVAPPAAEQSAAARLDEVVVVASRHPEPRREVIGSVSVIDRDQLERLQARHIEDAVRYEPGVVVARDAQRFAGEGFNLRGLQGNRVAVRIDGVPLPQGFTVGSFANAGRDQIAVEWIDRMEILRGPASALYGSDALAGVVAIETLDPLRLLLRPGQQAESVVAVHGADQGRSFASWVAARGERFGAFLGLQRRDFAEQHNHPPPGGLAANPVDARMHTGLLKLGGRFGGFDLALALEAYAAEGATEVRSQVNGPGQFATTERLLGDDRERRWRGLVQGALTPESSWAERVEFRLYRQQSETRQDTRQWRRAAPPAQRFPSLRERHFALDQHQLGVELGLRATLDGRFPLRYGYGLEASELRVSGLRDGRETRLDTGAVSHVILGEQLPVRDFPDSRIRQFGFYATAEVGLGASRFSLVPALRYDRSVLDARADAVFRADYPNLPVVDTRHQALTPKLALRYAPSAEQRLYLAYNEGFRAPPFSDVNIALTLTGLNYVVRPNPALRPERSRGLELGWNYVGASGQARLALFDNRYVDLIESRVNLGPDASGAIVFQSLNRARARVHGGEFAAELELSALNPDWARYRLRAALAWARGADRARDLPLNSIQPDRAILAWLVRTPIPALELELIATAVAPMQRIDRSAAALYAPPGYVTYDAQIHFEFGAGSRLDLGLYNLGDIRYRSWSALRGVVVGVPPGVDFYTEPGRHAALRLTWAW